MNEQPSQQQLDFWHTFLDTLSLEQRPAAFEAWGFGDSPAMADELGALVAAGMKTATTGALWEYQHESEALPAVGTYSIILDGQKQPICITELVEVIVQPFNEVDAQFAYDEGEGDRSLEFWRRVHREFFTRILQPFGLTFSETMPVVCERFRVVYPLAVDT